MVLETVLFMTPLALWPLFRLLRSEDGRGRLKLRKYSLIYLALQAIANAYVWYSFLGGYNDWLMTLAFPYFILFTGGLVGLAIFLDRLRARPTEINR